MCLPATPLILGLAAAGTAAVSTIAQIQSAKATNKAIRAQHDARQEEIDDAAAAQINERLRQARREQGRIMVAAGESGINTSSPVIDALMLDAQQQAGLANQNTMANRESRKKATTAEANAAMVSKPTLLGAGLQIGLAGANAYLGARGPRVARPPEST